MAAIDALGDSTEDLQAVYGCRTCAVDGIREVTGCSEENGRLQVDSLGRHLLTVSTGSRLAEVELTAVALEMAGRYRSLCDRLERGWDNLDATEQARRRLEMDTLLDELLPQLWQADDDLLITRIR